MILEKKLTHFIKLYNPDVVGFTSYITCGVIKQYADDIRCIILILLL